MYKHDFFHPDMKLQNILVHREAVKIGDFALAREISSRSSLQIMFLSDDIELLRFC